ncbi:MAG: glycosyltransferase family 4 protein [Hyphomicrobiaceae bacterium]|nr:glycosyltransferase family 4 protein [Hyphomicrobiaceae bacterium]
MRKQLPHRRVTLFFHNDPLTMEGAVTTADRLKLAAQLDAIYCVSQFVREQFMQGLSSDIDNIHTVHCGADLSCYPVAEKREKIIFFAGRIVAEKGILELLEAFSRVRDLIPDWRLAIAGEDKGGMLWRRLSPGCLNLGRLSHSETLQWFSRAEISVVPTVSAEPFGRVAMEAMGCGSALITSGSGGLKEIVGDEAVVVGRPDPAVLANAIVALANDPDRRRRLQVLGKSRIARMFDINRIVEKFDDVRDQLLTGDEPVLSQPRTVRPFSRPAAVGR